MKTLKNFFALLVMGSLVLASCEKKNEGGAAVDPAPAPGEDEPEVVFPEIMPAVDAPGAGNITVAIYVPSNTCNGVILTGSFDGYKPGEKLHPFTPLAGEDRWFTITMPYSADFAAKAIALTAEGVADWGTQWGMNIPSDEIENVVILAGEAVLTEENGGEQKLTAVPDGTVVYIGIKEWKSAPCVERNKAGEATFTLTAAALPEGAVVGIVGKISDELNWDINNPIIMTAGENNTWSATAAVGASCEYKYFFSLDGTWSWDLGEDGGNRQMPLDLKANDTVEAWKGLPAEEPAE
jgi:hypothetical protein